MPATPTLRRLALVPVTSSDTVLTMLVHFTRLSTALDHIIPNKQLRMSRFADLNDPHEYRRRKIVFMIVERSEESVPMGEGIGALSRRMLENNIKVVSFSSDDAEIDGLDDSVVLKSSPMWAHYGDNHQGISLLFDEEGIKAEVLGRCGYGLEGVFQDIEYVNEIGRARRTIGAMTYDERFLGREEAEFASQYMEAIKGQWQYKHEDWKYEREKRGIIISSEDQVCLDVSDSLKGVVLGDRVDEESVADFRSLLPREVRIFKVIYSTGKYRYTIKELTD